MSLREWLLGTPWRSVLDLTGATDEERTTIALNAPPGAAEWRRTGVFAGGHVMFKMAERGDKKEVSAGARSVGPFVGREVKLADQRVRDGDQWVDRAVDGAPFFFAGFIHECHMVRHGYSTEPVQEWHTMAIVVDGSGRPFSYFIDRITFIN